MSVNCFYAIPICNFLYCKFHRITWICYQYRGLQYQKLQIGVAQKQFQTKRILLKFRSTTALADSVCVRKS